MSQQGPSTMKIIFVYEWIPLTRQCYCHFHVFYGLGTSQSRKCNPKADLFKTLPNNCVVCV